MSEPGDAPTLTGAVPTTVVVGTALVIAVAMCGANGIGLHRPMELAALALLGWASESGSSLVQRLSSFSLTSTIVGVAVVLCGPLGACVVGVVAAAFNLSSFTWVARIFNTVMSGWIGLAGGLAFHWLTPHSPLAASAGQMRTFAAPFVVACLSMFLTNALLLGLIIHATTAVSVQRTMRDFTRHSAPLYSIGALIAYLTVVLWLGADLSYFTILVMAPPLLLAQRTFAAIAAEASTEDEIVDALVAAMTLNRPGASAHSALVRIIAQELGNVAGLAEGRARAVDRAASLHHLGLVTAEAHESSTMSPAAASRGARVVDQVAFLSSARDLIAAQSGAAAIHDQAALGVLATADALADELERIAADHPLELRDFQAAVRRVGTNDSLDPAARVALGHASRSPWARWLLAWTGEHSLSRQHAEMSP
ncbi:hypothetical protein [Calidifontibacter terrae]